MKELIQLDCKNWVLKQANITLAFKNGQKGYKNNYRPVNICLMYQRCLTNKFSGKYQIIWLLCYQNINADLEKATAHEIFLSIRLGNGNVK